MNRVFLLGRLCADPETRYTNSNIAMTRFRIAVNRPGKHEEGPEADFFQITAWRKTAEFVGKYFKKGRQILLEGRLQNNNWTDKDGNKRYKDDIVADQVYFADSKRDNGNTATANQPPAKTGQPEGSGFYDMNENDEDLPF